MSTSSIAISNEPQLVPVFLSEIGGVPTNVCDGRTLHTYLENRDMFANWIKSRIEKFGFVEDQDFGSFLEKTKKPSVGRPSKEYHLTLDMAKELSMVENNEKGRQARRYFIAMEHKALEVLQDQVQAFTATISPEQQNALQRIVKRKAETEGGAHPYYWSRFNNHFKLGSYKQLPATRFDEAVAYLEAIPTTQAKPKASPQQPNLPLLHGTQRLLVVVEDGRIAHISDMNRCSVVNADELRIVRRNLHLMAQQLRRLDGDESGEVLEKKLEKLH